MTDPIEALRRQVGQDLGAGPWVQVTQARIDQFAAATGDFQWIHVDAERAKAGPYGTTVAHGLLTLSMIGDLAKDLFRFDGFRLGLNYGFDRIRFITPVPVGSRLRARMVVASCTDIPGGVETRLDVTVEIEGGAKPACVAHWITRQML